MSVGRIISAGHTGVERAALLAAKDVGIKTGGWMMHGFEADDGKHPDYEEYFGMHRSRLKTWKSTMRRNMCNSNETICVFSSYWDGLGHSLTSSKPYNHHLTPFNMGINNGLYRVRDWYDGSGNLQEGTLTSLASGIKSRDSHIIHVTGADGSEQIQTLAYRWLYRLFQELKS